MRQRIDQLEIENDDLKQRGRLSCLIFSGSAIPEPVPQEVTVDVIRGLLLRLMQFHLSVDQVDVAFRLRNQSVLVKFKSTANGSDRDRLFWSKIALRGTGLFVAESLTARRQGILRTLVQLKKEKLIYAAYTQSGDIFVRMCENSRPNKIADQAAVSHLIETTRPVEQRRTRAADGGGPAEGAAVETGAPHPVSTETSENTDHSAPAAVSAPAPAGRNLASPLRPVISVGA